MTPWAATDLPSAGRKFLVTGGCGLVGSRVVRLLARAGGLVDVLDPMDAYDFDYGTLFAADRYARRLIRGSTADKATLAALPDDYDIVIHAGAYADVAGCNYNPMADFSANILGTQLMLERVRQTGVERFVFVSSASVYGSPPWAATGRPPQFAENSNRNGESTYANSKLWGENQTALYGKLHGLSTTVLRYFSVYGAPQVPKYLSHSWCVAWFAMCAMKGTPIMLNGGGHQVRDFIHVDDVATATVAAALAPAAAGLALNVGTGIGTRVREVADMVASHFGTVEMRTAPRPMGDPLGGYADTRLIMQTMAWAPTVPLAIGIEDYIEWLRRDEHSIPAWLG